MRTQETLDSVTQINGEVKTILRYAHNLENLQVLPEIKTSLLNAATGRDQVPLKVFLIVLAAMGVLILALVFLLTGQKYGFIPGITV